jgi:hypothetical protein
MLTSDLGVAPASMRAVPGMRGHAGNACHALVLCSLCDPCGRQQRHKRGSARLGECGEYGGLSRAPRRQALEEQLRDRAAERQRQRAARLREPPPDWLQAADAGHLPYPASAAPPPRTRAPLAAGARAPAPPPEWPHHPAGAAAPGAAGGRAYGPLLASASTADRPSGESLDMGNAGVAAEALPGHAVRLPPLAPWQQQRLEAHAAGAPAAAPPAEPWARAAQPLNAWVPGHVSAQSLPAANAWGAPLAGRADARASDGAHSPAPAARQTPAGHGAAARGGRPDAQQAADGGHAAAQSIGFPPYPDAAPVWLADPYRPDRLGRGRGHYSPERRAAAPAAPQPAPPAALGAAAARGGGAAADSPTGRAAVEVQAWPPCPARASRPGQGAQAPPCLARSMRMYGHAACCVASAQQAVVRPGAWLVLQCVRPALRAVHRERPEPGGWAAGRAGTRAAARRCTSARTTGT